MKLKIDNFEIEIDDSDVVNVENCIYEGEYNPHNVHPWILLDHGFVVAIVFASHLQDALDEAVDADKMDRFLIDESDYIDYDLNTDSPTCAFLGNASEPFDIDTLGYIELAPPKRSFVSELINHHPLKVLGTHFA